MMPTRSDSLAPSSGLSLAPETASFLEIYGEAVA